MVVPAPLARRLHVQYFIFEQAQSFQVQGIGEKRLINMIVGKIDVISSCHLISDQRAIASTPVAPLAGDQLIKLLLGS
jgi:hypothetical protein